MKNRMLIPLILVVTFSLFSSPANGYAKSGPLAAERISSQTNAFDVDVCKSKNKDKDAPCTVEVFSYVQEDLTSAFTITPYAAGDVSKVVTCGVNIKNGGGSLVAVLSETVYARWNSTTHYVDNSTRYSWVSSAIYWWTNLSGPTPKTGWAQFQSPVVPTTTGTLKWTLGTPVGHKVVTTINGTQTNLSWGCNGSY